MRDILHRTVPKTLFRRLVFSLFFLLFPSFVSSQTSEGEEGAVLRASEIQTLPEADLLQQAREAGLTVTTADEARAALLERAGVPIFAAGEGVEVAIESSDALSTFTMEKTGDSVVELRGDVVLSLKEKGADQSHRVRAAYLIWNESKRALYAQGAVGYVYTKGGQTSRFQGKTLFLSLGDKRLWMQGTLGQTPWSQEGQSLQLSFGGRALEGVAIGDEQIQVIQDGFITTSRIPSPYYRLQAKKIWILGKDEWAVWNAVLYLGEVPVFYFPFYFHTDKQFLFYPQIGFDPFRGAFLNTTTYFIGQQAGITNAIDLDRTTGLYGLPNQPKRRLQGLWWETTGDALESTDYLKLMVDGYFNLGFYAAVDFHFRRPEVTYRGHFGLGLTRTLYPHAGDFFYPFPNNPSQSYSLGDLFTSNTTYLFGVEIPLRWAFLYEQEQEIGDWKFTLQAEHYSDAYVYRDFLNQRSESLNPWMSFVLVPYSAYLGRAPDFDNFYMNTGYLWDFRNPLVTQFAQNFTLSYDREDWFPFYIRSFHWGITQAGLFWSARGDTSRSIFEPRSSWFYLQEIKFPQTQLDMRGSLWEWAKQTPRPTLIAPVTLKEGEIPSVESPLLAPEPFAKEDLFTKPLRDSSFGLYYTYNPSLGFSTFWDGSGWDKQSDSNLGSPDWVVSNWQNYLRIDGLGAFWGRFLILQTSTTVNSHWLASMYESSLYQDLRHTRDDVTIHQSVTVGSYFAQDNRFFKNSYARQTLGLKFFSYMQDFAQGQMTRSWKHLFKEGALTKNETELYVEFSEKLGGVGTSFKFNTPNASWTLEEILRGWINFHPFKAEMLWGYSIKEGAYQHYLWRNYLVYAPVPDILVRGGVSYNPNISQLDSIEFFFKASLFQFGFWYKQATPYTFDPVLRDWKVTPGFENGKTLFTPHKMRLALVGDVIKVPFWEGRGLFFWNLDTGYETLLTRFTEGEFWFKTRLGLRLNNFTEISIATFSNNTQMFRYFPSLLDKLGYPDAGLSFCQDLSDALSFWNTEALRRTNFKWQSFELRFRQIFYDWYLDATWTAVPVRSENSLSRQPTVSFQNRFSISVRWTPLRSIRAYLKKERNDEGYRTGIGEDALTRSTIGR